MKILLGLDLASESNRYFALDERGQKVGSGPLSWSWEAWATLMDDLGGPEHVIAAFETSPEAYRAESICIWLGVETYPFHAGHFKKPKKKTDKRDAERFARALRGDNLPERVELPSEEIAQLRNLVSEREQYLKILRKVHNRAKNLARQWGLALPTYNKRKPQQWWEQLLESVGPKHRPAYARMATVAFAALQSLDLVQEAMEEQVEKAGLQEATEILTSVPGFGRLTAICVAAFLETGTRFSSGRKVADYVGLVPCVDQTGKHTNDERILGHITKDGPPILRRILVQAAHSAANSKKLERTRWKPWFLQLKKRRGRRIAIVALARKLIVTAHALLRDEKEWDPEMLRPTAA